MCSGMGTSRFPMADSSMDFPVCTDMPWLTVGYKVTETRRRCSRIPLIPSLSNPGKSLGTSCLRGWKNEGGSRACCHTTTAALPATAPCPKDWTETPSSSLELPTVEPLPAYRELYPAEHLLLSDQACHLLSGLQTLKASAERKVTVSSLETCRFSEGYPTGHSH